MSCPRCRQTVTVMPPGHEEATTVSNPSEPTVAPTTPLSGLAAVQSELMKSLTAVFSAAGMGSPGQAPIIKDKWRRRRLLICVEDAGVRERLRHALNPDNFEVFTASLAQEANEILQEFKTEVIVLSPMFDHDHSGGATMMQYVNRLTPPSRRKTYVCLVSPQLRTLDTYLAFANGVNLTVHPEDVDSFQSVLERSIRDYNELYRPIYQATDAHPF
ncbi:MAG: hypothetical protein ACREDR_26765 [Blastocatellia bacterium]